MLLPFFLALFFSINGWSSRNNGVSAAKRVFNNPLPFRRRALVDFTMLYKSTQDLAGELPKVIGAPSVILQAFGERFSSYLPSTRQFSTGCRVPNNDVVGPAARGSYDLLLAPDASFGVCATPSLNDSTVTWHGEVPDRQSYETSKGLPPADEVWEHVFARKEAKPRTIDSNQVSLNFWFVSFVNWFHDDNFRTAPNTDGTYTWNNAVGSRLAQVYGDTLDRQAALRSFAEGKMKVQSIGSWEYFPPSYAAVKASFPDFVMWTPEQGPGHDSAAGNKTDSTVREDMYFAIGDPRFNMHPGHILWASIALYVHNQACDAILGSNPELNDEEVFQRARTILFHTVQATRLHQFVSDSIGHTRDHFRLQYDPPVLRKDLGSFLNFAGGVPNYIEFNHIYQAWHSFIPDSLYFDDEKVPLEELLWLPSLFHERPLSEIARSFTITPVAKYGPHSFQPFLRGITIQALQDERSQRMIGYNEYRKLFGLDPLQSFDQLGVDNHEQLSALYGHDIDSLELFPGILADNQASIPGNLVGDMQLVMVALLALEDLTSNDVVSNPSLWTEEFLTKGGFAFLRNYDFGDMLKMLLDNTMATPECPFRSSDVGCVPATMWIDHSSVPKCFLCMSSVCSLVGADLTEWFFDESGYMRYFVIAQTFAFVIVCGLYLGAFYVLPRAMKQSMPRNEQIIEDPPHQPRSNDINRIRRAVLLVNSITTLSLTAPLSFVWVEMVSNPNWIEEYAESSYKIALWGASIVSVVFMAEIILRLHLYYSTNQRSSASLIIAHHIGYYFLVIATFSTADVGVHKIGMTFLTAFCWEWSLFLPFLSLRLYEGEKPETRPSEAFHRIVKVLFPVCLAVYFATRLVEIVCFLQIVICGGSRYFGINTISSGPFWTVVPFSLVPLALQLQAGCGLFSLWRRKMRSLSREIGSRRETQISNNKDDLQTADQALSY